jgi:hypothetical protein
MLAGIGHRGGAKWNWDGAVAAAQPPQPPYHPGTGSQITPGR